MTPQTRDALMKAVEALELGIAHAEYDDASIDTYVAFRDAANPAIEKLRAALAEDEKATTITDYEAVIADHKRLVRELDVALNGKDGAAEQASLCDIVAQVKNENWSLIKSRPTQSDEELARELMFAVDSYLCAGNQETAKLLIIQAFAKVREDEKGRK